MTALNELVSGFCQPDEPEHVIIVQFVGPDGMVIRSKRHVLSTRPPANPPPPIHVQMDLRDSDREE